jgi:hypothetical protein
VTVDNIVHIFAGIAILVGVALSHFVHPNWIWLVVFVGANLFQSGFTKFCPLAFMLKKGGVREGSCC